MPPGPDTAFVAWAGDPAPHPAFVMATGDWPVKMLGGFAVLLGAAALIGPFVRRTRRPDLTAIPAGTPPHARER